MLGAEDKRWVGYWGPGHVHNKSYISCYIRGPPKSH